MSQEIEALETVKTTLRYIVDERRTQDPLGAFKLACFLSNIQFLISSAEDVLKCLNSTDNRIESIGVGALPALNQQLDQLIPSLDEAGIDCVWLKSIVPHFQAIVTDLPNYDFPFTD